MNKTLMEIKNFIYRVKSRQNEIEIQIRELRKEWDSLNQVKSELESLLDVAELESEDSND